MNPTEPSTPHENEKNSVIEKMGRALADVLERAAFMFSETADLSVVRFPDTTYYHAKLQFSGPEQGQLVLTAPVEFCVQLAANILGEDLPQIRQEQAQDALKELLNVTCGEFLEYLSGTNAVYNLSIPSISQITQAEMEELSLSDQSVLFLVDDLPVLIYIRVPHGQH